MSIVIYAVIDFSPEKVDEFLTQGEPFIKGALSQDGCLNYDWSKDINQPGRVRVFEHWADETALRNHFAGEWFAGMGGLVGQFGPLSMDASKYRVDLIEPVMDETGAPRPDFFTAGDG